MTFRSLLNDTATIERLTPEEFDDFGNVTETWETLSEDVPCRLDERAGDENTDDRESPTRAATLFLLPLTDIEFHDRVIVAGETWEVSGHPVRRKDANVERHIEVSLRKVKV